MRKVTTEARYLAVWEELESNPDLHTFENRESCCRSCALSEIGTELGEGEHNVVWTFNGQGDGIQFIKGQPHSIPEEYEEEEVEEDVWEAYEESPKLQSDVYIYFSNATEELVAAKSAKAAFEKHGFTVNWDGTAHTALEVIF